MKRSRPPRRTPVRPSTKPLKRSELPRARTRIRSRKADPTKRRFAKHRCDPFRDWLKTQQCPVSGFYTDDWRDTGNDFMARVIVDPAHTRPRSLGADDLYECIPLARHLHDEQERIGWPRFEKKYGIDRKALAKKYADEWLATPEGAEYGGRYTEQEA